MKGKKGFTLIELLAIIVILAVIAVITVPIILNVIENSKKGAATDSAYGYRDAIQKFYMSDLLDNENTVLPSGIKLVSALPNDFEVSGEKPTNDSWVQLEKGQVVAYSLKFGDYTVTKYTNSDVVCEKGDVQENEEARAMRLAIEQATTDVENYIVALLDDDTIKAYTTDKSKKVSEISNPVAPTGIDTNSWVYFAYDNNATENKISVSDYSIKITEGKYTFVFNCTNGVAADPVESTTIENQMPSFADDSWADIVTNLTANRNAYRIGATKIISFDRDNEGDTGYGTNEYYRLRLVNTSPCSSSTATSKTSCGVVIEFVTIIGTNVMNGSNTNLGGWYDSTMRSYLNTATDNIFSKLPSDLQDVIIPTAPIVSGSGSRGNSSNVGTFEGDMLYLLSGREVGLSLDYDNKKEATDTNILKYYEDNNNNRMKYSTTTEVGTDSTESYWWLRSARSNSTSDFYLFCIDGIGRSSSAFYSSYGVAPAFRIMD